MDTLLICLSLVPLCGAWFLAGILFARRHPKVTPREQLLTEHAVNVKRMLDDHEAAKERLNRTYGAPPGWRP